MTAWHALGFFLLMMIAPVVEAECRYRDLTGKVLVTKTREEIPVIFRRNAHCEQLVSPDKISLEGNLRVEKFATPLGKVELRWPRTAEELFGTTPNRAVIDAMRTARRALRTAGVVPHKLIPPEGTVWQVVVMDKGASQDEVPSYLISNCHPGWMVPPAKIYLVAQAVAKGCSGRESTKPDADVALTRVLLHEIGHVVEYHLLASEGENISRNRARAEGFASWFEQYSSDFSQIIPRGSTRKEYLTAAATALRRGYRPKAFHGTFYDYALASASFRAIELKGGFPKIVKVYERMIADSLPFNKAVKKVTYWTEDQQGKEILKVLSKY